MICFQCMLLTCMPHSFDIIKKSWVVTVTSLPTHILAIEDKNKKTKKALCQWNKEEARNIFHRSELLKLQIESLQTNEADYSIIREDSYVG